VSSNILVSVAVAAGIALPIGALDQDTQYTPENFQASFCEIATDAGQTEVPCIINIESGKKYGVS